MCLDMTHTDPENADLELDLGEFLSAKEVAELIRTDPETVVRWGKRREPKACPIPELIRVSNGHYLFRKEEITAWRRKIMEQQ